MKLRANKDRKIPGLEAAEAYRVHGTWAKATAVLNEVYGEHWHRHAVNKAALKAGFRVKEYRPERRFDETDLDRALRPIAMEVAGRYGIQSQRIYAKRTPVDIAARRDFVLEIFKRFPGITILQVAEATGFGEDLVKRAKKEGIGAPTWRKLDELDRAKAAFAEGLKIAGITDTSFYRRQGSIGWDARRRIIVYRHLFAVEPRLSNHVLSGVLKRLPATIWKVRKRLAERDGGL